MESLADEAEAWLHAQPENRNEIDKWHEMLVKMMRARVGG